MEYNSALNFPIYTNNPYWDAYRTMKLIAETALSETLRLIIKLPIG